MLNFHRSLSTHLFFHTIQQLNMSKKKGFISKHKKNEYNQNVYSIKKQC